MHHNKIYTFTGASGAGKTTIAGEILKLKVFKLVESITTRMPRASDLPGEYRYVTDEEFEAMAKNGDFLWRAHVHGISYGTTSQSIDEALQSPHYSIMILVPHVIPLLYAYTKRFQPFYILSPSPEILEARLHARGESEDKIKERLRDCAEWDKQAKASDIPYIFIENESTPEAAALSVLNQLK